MRSAAPASAAGRSARGRRRAPGPAWRLGSGWDSLRQLLIARKATIAPARYLEREATLGTVAAGKAADLVLLDADPLVAIGNTRRIAAVVVRGRYLPRTEIERMLAEEKSLAARE